MATKPIKKNQESESLQEQIVKLQKQLESFKHSNDHFLKNKLFLHYDIKEPEKVIVDCETKLPVLTEVEKKNIQQGSESDPTHLIIEGDNYHALSVLNYTHAGKIDLIYIDPPYNTGNKDFIYNDRFVDREDSFRHSKWLSFMAHRLHLAKNLLIETGVIFISIDDNEQAHLRLLCDQIFGEENFVACLVWQNKEGGGKSDSKFFRNKHEYILVYAKNIFSANIYGQPVEDVDRYKLSDKYVETRGKYQLIKLDSGSLGWVKSLDYPINLAGETFYAGGDKKKWEERQRGGAAVKDWGWRWSMDKLKWGIANDFVVVKGDNIYTKQYLNVDRDGNIINGRKIQPLGVIDGYSTTQANRLTKEIFGKVDFNYAKPVELIEYIVKIATNESATVLDFFAGSGTTGHAVLKLNAQDGGKRQFILCTNNENKIAEEVTYPRIKKVIDGYGDNAPIPSNLRYFKNDFIEKKGSASQLKIDLTRKCAEMLCVKENVFEAVKTKKSAKNYQFFKNGNKYLGVFFDFFTDPEFADFIAELNKLPQEAEKIVYIFVLDGSASIFADEFSGVANCEIKEIPQKILDIYKQLAREVARK